MIRQRVTSHVLSFETRKLKLDFWAIFFFVIVTLSVDAY